MPSSEKPITTHPRAPESISGILELARSTLQETNKQAVQLESLSKDMKSVIEQVSGLSTILRGPGDGERGIVWRMAMIEKSSQTVGEDVHSLKEALSDRTLEDQRGRWKLVQAVLVAIVALIASVLGAILSGLFHWKSP